MKNLDNTQIITKDGTVRPAQFANEKVAKGIASVAAGTVPVIEVFRTLEGEGLHIGTPRVLARVSGCMVQCSWCDTKHSWAAGKYQRMTVQQLYDEITRLADGYVNEVSITGGEPLHYPRFVTELADKLHLRGLTVSVETSGILFNADVFNAVDLISMDIKTPSAGLPISQWQLDAYLHLQDSCRTAVQFKSVICNQSDLDWVSDNLKFIYMQRPSTTRNPLILTPGVRNTRKSADEKTLQSELQRVVDMILDWNRGYNIRVITQMHQLLSFR